MNEDRMAQLERRVADLEIQISEVLETTSKRRIGSSAEPLEEVVLASRDNPGVRRVVEIDNETGDVTTRKVDT